MFTRKLYLFGFLIVCALLTFSIYLQRFKGFIPCPLCSLQRMAFTVLGILFLIGFFVYRKWLARLIVTIFLAVFSLVGLSLAGRQIWLQHFPTHTGDECGAGLKYMLSVLPIDQVLKQVIVGSGECTERGWEWLSLDLADWSMVWFAIFFLGSLYLLVKVIPRRF